MWGLAKICRIKVFTKLFGAAKLVSETDPDPNRSGRDDVISCMTYVVRRILSHQDCDDLHTVLVAAHFSRSPRYGAKPVHGTSFIMMSLFESTNISHYSLGIYLDLKNQTIRIDSYQLGSKYDRL